MILKAIVDDQLLELNVPEELVAQAEDFFAGMDRDMDKGWQMSRQWVDHPDREQRCRIVADKLLTCLEEKNDRLGRLMAGYILSRMPEAETVEIDTSGEIQNTRFGLRESPQNVPEQAPSAAPPAADTAGMDKMAALEQAGQDVTKVFRVGRNWRYSVYDHAQGQWRDAPQVADREEAERMRQEAFRARYEALLGSG